MLYTDVLAFKTTGRLKHCNNGYAGIDQLFLPIYQDMDWHQLHDAVQWINPRILCVDGLAFSYPASWEKLGLLVTGRVQVLNLSDLMPYYLVPYKSRKFRPIHDEETAREPDDKVRPYRLLDIPPEALLVLRHLPNLHHISISFDDHKHFPVPASNPADTEMAFISHLALPCLTSLYIHYDHPSRVPW